MKLSIAALLALLMTVGCAAQAAETTITAPAEPVVSSDSAAWLDYSSRAITYNNAMVPIFKRMSSAATAFDIPELASVAQEGRLLALTQHDWLASNPPRACYKQIYDLSVNQADTLATAYGLAIEFGDTMEPATLKRVSTMVKDVNETTQRMTAMIPDIRCG